jgi:hypothetical protein
MDALLVSYSMGPLLQKAEFIILVHFKTIVVIVILVISFRIVLVALLVFKALQTESWNQEKAFG